MGRISSTWKSGGKYYHFNEYGVRVYQWFITTDDASTAETTKGWAYFNSPEDGARATKGWFTVVPPTDDNSFYEDDGDTITYITGFTTDMFLVNTSGKIQTGKKSGTKDGEDWYWYTIKSSGKTGNGNIIAYANSKDLKDCWADWADAEVVVSSATDTDTDTDADTEE